MKVVVAEDNHRHRDALVDQLTQHGFFVVAVESGDEVLDVVDEIAPEVIILDMRLPGKDGLSLARELRRQQRAERPYLLALTANAFPEDREQALKAGFDAFLAKPYDEAELVQIVATRPRFGAPDVTRPAKPRDVDLAKVKELLHDVRDALSPNVAQRWPQADREAISSELNALLTLMGSSTALRSPQAPLYRPQAPRPRLLVVENDRGQSKALTGLFNGVGYDVVVAHDENDVHSALSTGGFAGYLVDLRLGDISGIELVKQLPLYMDPKRNVVFMSVAPRLFERELAQIEGPRVYDKTSNAYDELIRLTREVAPLQNNPLIAEQDVSRAGNALLGEVRTLLTESGVDVELDTRVLALCRNYSDAVAASPSQDLNKYLIASDCLLRCLVLLQSPLMHLSRKACFEAYWRLRAKWLRGSRRYGTWAYEQVWGLLTGYGQNVARILGTLVVIVVGGTSAVALWPSVMSFSVNGTTLQDVPLAERWWTSLYIAASNSLLVGTEGILPTSVGSQALILVQTVFSLVLLGMAVGALLSRFRSGS